MLSLLLADESVLYMTTRDYHWNLIGSEFPGLPHLLEVQYGQIADWVDQVAARARTTGLDAGAERDWVDLINSARVSADPGISLSGGRMLSELLALHGKIIGQLRLDRASGAGRFNDVGAADFLTGLMEWHEKTAARLRAQLETEEDASTRDRSVEMAGTRS